MIKKGFAIILGLFFLLIVTAYNLEASSKRILVLPISENRVSVSLNNLPSKLKFPITFKRKIKYNSVKRKLFFNGIMSDSEKQVLLKLSGNRYYQHAINNLYLKSMLDQKGITQIINTNLALAKFKTTSYYEASQIAKDLGSDKIKLSDLALNYDYLITGELISYNKFSLLTIKIIDIKNQKIIFEDQNRFFTPYINEISRFFNISHIQIDNNTEIQSHKIFSLVNPLSEKVISLLNKLEIKTPKNIEDVNGVEIMFIIDSTRSMKDEINTLRNKIRSIVEWIRYQKADLNVRISITDFKNVYDSYRANILPFTSSISKVESYLDRLDKSDRDDEINDIYYGLYYGLTHGKWSVYQNYPKIIFLLTDRPIQNEIPLLDRKKIVVLPFKSSLSSWEYNNLQNEKKQAIHQLLISKLNLSKGKVIPHKLAQQFIMESKFAKHNVESLIPVIKRKFNTRYFVTGTLKKDRKYLVLTTQIFDSRNKKIIKTVQQRTLYSTGPLSIINSSGNEILSFFEKISFIEKGTGIRRQYESNFKEIIKLAKSKAINIYTIGCSGIDQKSQSILSRVSQLIGGDYYNLEYKLFAYQKDDQKINFIYKNQKLYYTQNQRLIYSNISHTAHLRELTMGRNIPTVEQVKQFLITEGYPINEESFLTKNMKNNLSKIILNVLKNYIDPSANNFNEVIVKIENYNNFPIQIKNLTKKDLNNLKTWLSEKREIILASPILPSTPYNVAFKENNRQIEKVIFFMFHPSKTKIISPNLLKNIPSYLIKSITEINKDPYIYRANGVSYDAYWFVKGKLIDLKLQKK
ncbi:MAG: VWA domain-containing protein [Spirochaetota bacterium]|nr:VWA domain-containing protein [Spirochaetota bacterium]